MTVVPSVLFLMSFQYEDDEHSDVFDDLVASHRADEAVDVGVKNDVKRPPERKPHLLVAGV